MEITYLLKFTSKYIYAKDLLDGKLYMNQACYYHNLEVGQGDIREGAIDNQSMSYSGTSHPIYCLYAAYENQLVDNNIIVPEKLKTDFQAEYVTVVKYKEFWQMLKNNELETEYAVSFGEVKYRFLNWDDTCKILEDKKNACFYKKPKFKYQQEFRIMVYENLNDITEKKIIDGLEVECIVDRESKTYLFNRDLVSIAKIIKLDDCKHTDENIFINLNLEGR